MARHATSRGMDVAIYVVGGQPGLEDERSRIQGQLAFRIRSPRRHGTRQVVSRLEKRTGETYLRGCSSQLQAHVSSASH